MKGVTAVVIIFGMLLVSVTVTGAAWLSIQSMFFSNGDAADFDIPSENIQCSGGKIRIEAISRGEAPLTSNVFLPVEIRKTDDSYETTCHSECLKLDSPLEEGQTALLFEWDCHDEASYTGCSLGSYIVSFKTEQKTIEELVNC